MVRSIKSAKQRTFQKISEKLFFDLYVKTKL